MVDIDWDGECEGQVVSGPIGAGTSLEGIPVKNASFTVAVA